MPPPSMSLGGSGCRSAQSDRAVNIAVVGVGGKVEDDDDDGRRGSTSSARLPSPVTWESTSDVIPFAVSVGPSGTDKVGGEGIIESDMQLVSWSSKALSSLAICRYRDAGVGAGARWIACRDIDG